MLISLGLSLNCVITFCTRVQASSWPVYAANIKFIKISRLNIKVQPFFCSFCEFLDSTNNAPIITKHKKHRTISQFTKRKSLMPCLSNISTRLKSSFYVHTHNSAHLTKRPLQWVLKDHSDRCSDRKRLYLVWSAASSLLSVEDQFQG